LEPPSEREIELMETTQILGSTLKNGLNRRKFLKGMAATASLGLSAGLLAACGDNTPTPALAPATSTTAPATTASAAATPTTAPTTVAVSTAAPTTAAVTTNAPTTVPATTAAATSAASTTAAVTTAASGTTVVASGAAPAGYVEVGKVSAARTVPVGFAAGATKGYIFAENDSKVFVYSNICTHMGCEVPAFKPAQKMFMCPCHGSEYTSTGEVISGPAKLRLPLFDNKVVGDIIYAKLS
jgi:Rieske Fe-S protein